MPVKLAVDKDGSKRVELPFSLIKSLYKAVGEAISTGQVTDGVFHLNVSESSQSWATKDNKPWADKNLGQSVKEE